MKKVTLIAARRYDGLEGSVKAGQTLKVSEDRAAELIRRGLAAPEGQEAGPVQHAGEQSLQLLSPGDQAALEAKQKEAQGLADENTKLKADLERLNAQLTQLKADAKADAKKHADEVKGLKADVKAAQAERDAALAKIPKEAADAAGQPAGGE